MWKWFYNHAIICMKWGKTVENIIDKIYAQMSNMSTSDQKVGRTILKNPAVVINITISQ